MRLAIVGYGKMGRAIGALARERGHELVSVVNGPENRHGEGLSAMRLEAAEVAVEFTSPTAAPGNIRRLIELGVPTVTGSTGWYDELPAIGELVAERNGALLYSPNFSVGVQCFLRAAADLARRLAAREAFDGFIVEEHHAAKRDAPSGTAFRLQGLLHEADPERSFPITSVRGGSIPGTHRLVYDSAEESIVLEHQARSRRSFASGVLDAVEWIRGRTGVFTFEEMLFGRDP